MAIDNKYGRVSFEESNTIGENEPVVVFRAADPMLPKVLHDYFEGCAANGSPRRHLGAIAASQTAVLRWQDQNPGLVRELPTSSNWDGKDRIGE